MYKLITYFLSLSLLSVAGKLANAADEVVYFHPDVQGSAIAAYSESGALCWKQDYTPYGEKIDPMDGVPATGCGLLGGERGFTGHVQDVSSDLVYMQQRYYDPALMRFRSIDPVGVIPEDHRHHNRYSYAFNNPYTYTDPTGEIPVNWSVPGHVEYSCSTCDSYNQGRMEEARDQSPPTVQDVILVFEVGSYAVGGVGFSFGKSLFSGIRNYFGKLLGKRKNKIDPSISKLSRPSTPNGMTLGDFGRKLVKWGAGPDDALKRINEIDKSTVTSMRNLGLTKEMAEEWRDFYKNEYRRNSGNTTAANRVKLMNRIIREY